MEEHKCVALLMKGFHSHSCNKPAKMQDEKGRWYCGIHSPEAVEKRKAKRKAKQDARYAAWKEEIDDEEKARIRNMLIVDAFPEIMAALKTPGFISHVAIHEKYKHLLEGK